jgi:carbonic anhydrase
MRLLQAILDANRRLTPEERRAPLDLGDVSESLPLAALTCIDARLNHVLPDVLGVPEEKFIWLRNAGNIVTGPLSSTLRSLALACAVKGAREIAIIGHSDCQVAKTTILNLTDRLKAMGVDRTQLPENLIEYFGVFASERQNVLKAVDIVRSSPLIGSRIPVHGLLLDLQSGRLECLVDGYSAPATTASALSVSLELGDRHRVTAKLDLPGFQLGEMKFPEFKIGDMNVALSSGPATHAAIGTASQDVPSGVASAQGDAAGAAAVPAPRADASRLDWRQIIQEAIKYRVIGSDQKLYGPVTGRKLLDWIASGNVDEQTPIQVEGSTMWQPLISLAEMLRRHKHLPPVIKPGTKLKRDKR